MIDPTACRECGVALTEENWGAYIRSIGRRICRTCERAEILAAYGGHCVCCGESTPEFLSIDHINGGGSAHRRSINRYIYRFLKETGFPKNEFRLLCYNCNMARAKYGTCPHERVREESV
jgi:hypothetical protein